MVLGKKLRRALMWAMVATLLAGLVYAIADVSGQANKSTADAGSAGASMEMASLDTVKQSKSKPVNWQQERALRKRIDAVDAQYRQLVTRAQAEIASAGAVTPGTRGQGIATAGRFQQASENYAAFWDQNNGRTRARLARETGKARVKNAEMTFNAVDSDRVKAYNAQQDELAKARKAYLAEAKSDVSDADRAAIKAQAMPRLRSLASQMATLISTVASLLNSIREQSGGMITGAVSGCSKAATGGGGVNDGVAALFSPVTNLLALVKSMAGNIQSTMSDVASL